MIHCEQKLNRAHGQIGKFSAMKTVQVDLITYY